MAHFTAQRLPQADMRTPKTPLTPPPPATLLPATQSPTTVPDTIFSGSQLAS